MRPGQIRPGNSVRADLDRRVGVASMRPGQIRPGNLYVIPIRVANVIASMRPGQIRPGNAARPEDQGGQVLASMRPGQIRPGNGENHGTESTRQGSFNEAGANSPRKWRESWHREHPARQLQ